MRNLALSHDENGLHTVDGKYPMFVQKDVADQFDSQYMHEIPMDLFISDDCPAETYQYEMDIPQEYLEEVNDTDAMAIAAPECEDIILEDISVTCIWLEHVVIIDIWEDEKENKNGY